MVSQYEVVNADYPSTLAQVVNAKLKLGFILVGGPFTITSSYGQNTWYQAVAMP